MSIFAISDLHLSLGTNKPMDIFRGWENYTKKIVANWERIVAQQDIVIIPGDTSWATKLEETEKDFLFLDKLPGKKILLKGNHDYWWGTTAKISQFLEKNNFKTISILHNDAYFFDGVSICGTRGWLYDGTAQSDEKIILRECGRLETSIKKGIELGGELVVFLHYPPVYGEFLCEEIFQIIKKYQIKHIFYGHIHGAGFNKSLPEYDGVKLHLVSCDCIDFTPILVDHYIKNK